MSLIQEALKKQQEEMDTTGKKEQPTSQKESAAGPPKEKKKPALRPRLSSEADNKADSGTSEAAAGQRRPATLKPREDAPFSQPASPGTEQTESDRGDDATEESEEPGATAIWPSLFGALAFLLFVAALLYGSWYGYLHLRAGAEEPGPETPATTNTASAPPAVTGVVETVEDEGPETVVALDGDQEDESETNEVAVLPDNDTEATSDVDVPASTTNVVVENDTTPGDAPDEFGDETADVPSPTVPEEPEKPVWPLLTLDGFLGRGLGGTAVLNGEMVPVGNEIQGVKVMLIESKGVILRYKGQLRRLRRGQSTD